MIISLWLIRLFDLLYLVLISIKDIYMSTTQVPTPGPEPPAKTAISKKELAGDIIAFFSIIGSYLFISITLHFNIFEGQFGIHLDNYSLITFLYLAYAAFIIVLRIVAPLPALLNTKAFKNVASTINQHITDSLFNVLLISSLYIFIHGFVTEITLQQFCHIAIWLWIGETVRMLGSFLGQITGIDSLSYWGWSVIWILFIGGVLESIGAGIFVLL